MQAQTNIDICSPKSLPITYSLWSNYVDNRFARLHNHPPQISRECKAMKIWTVPIGTICVVLVCGYSALAQKTASSSLQNQQTTSSSSQGTSSPVPDPGLRFSLWQNSSQSSSGSTDLQAQFRSWQGQRTSADSLNLFKCTASTDLDNPECVGKPPGTKITGTKDTKTPTTLPVTKSKTGDPL